MSKTASEPFAAPQAPAISEDPRPCPWNAPRTAWDYLKYPRVLLTLIICVVSAILHVVFGLYVLLR